jgi:carbon monoxide dehydrogenase subunit G
LKIAGEYELDGPRPLVWETLLDPQVLAGVLPGCEKLDLVGQDEYEGALNIKIGPVQGKFLGRVKLENLHPPDSYTMQVDGRGAPGFVKATGNLALTDAGAVTRVSYDGDAQVGGRLASVGQRLIESSAKAIIRQSLDGLNEAVRTRVASAAGGSADPAPQPAEGPSQARFAATVAREVAKDLIPSWALWVLAAVVVVVAAWLLFL